MSLVGEFSNDMDDRIDLNEVKGWGSSSSAPSMKSLFNNMYDL